MYNTILGKGKIFIIVRRIKLITLENISTLRLKNSLEYSIDREVIENHRLANYKLLKEFLQANGNNCFYRLKSAVHIIERN